jgi:hypothetical protein
MASDDAVVIEPHQLDPDLLREGEVGGVVAVQMADLTLLPRGYWIGDPPAA